MNRKSHLIKTPRVASFKIIFGLKNSSVHSTSWLDIACQSDSFNILNKTNISHQKAEKVWKLTKTSKNSVPTPHMKKEIQKEWQKSPKNWQKIIKYSKKKILMAISGWVVMFVEIYRQETITWSKELLWRESPAWFDQKLQKLKVWETYLDWRIPCSSLLFAWVHSTFWINWLLSDLINNFRKTKTHKNHMTSYVI